MSKLFVLKLGTTWPATAERHGDFDDWTTHALGATDVPLETVDIEHGAALPEHTDCAGVILTGSHAMVTDELPWSVNTQVWLVDALRQQIPILGVCYGHQLLARAAGGRVGYHPDGREIGTVEISCQPAARQDPLFADLPDPFLAHTTHAQSVLELPPEAELLAGNAYEPNHAFRVGSSAWGVQFHPEYSTVIMREYITGLAEQLIAAGRDIGELSVQVTDTPTPRTILRRFGAFVGEQMKTAAH